MSGRRCSRAGLLREGKIPGSLGYGYRRVAGQTGEWEIDPEEAAKAWGELDKEVTNQAYFINWLWDNNIGLQSKNMNGVSSKFNSGAYDFAFSSLK